MEEGRRGSRAEKKGRKQGEEGRGQSARKKNTRKKR